MIHVVLGTKAQLIKTAPVLKRLDEEGLPYRLIDTGQHGALTPGLRAELGIREPDAALGDGRSIDTVLGGLFWMFKLLAWATFRPRSVKRRVFGGQGGVCLIHGDTASALIALYLAKRAGLKVAHLEAGLRSWKLFDPFPEELIRLICMRGSELLFAPGDEAFANLQRMGLAGRAIHIGANTNVEAIRAALDSRAADPVSGAAGAACRPDGPYALMTLHRLETIRSRRDLAMAVDLACRIATDRTLCFVLHPPTERSLDRFGLLAALRRNPAIRLTPLVPYGEFLDLIAGAEFLVTDGGSIQEEAACLGLPCMVLRRRTERPDGLSANVRLLPFDAAAAADFLERYPRLRRPPSVLEARPSLRVVQGLREAA